MFAKVIEDWQRYLNALRSLHTFFGTICIAAAVIFGLGQ
ncbi:MAG: hypothetical protein JWN11_4 [Hyphomicrobiales bacterium]|nr:hypothetical protein [Hyphomicrobiales bacterium]